MVKKKFSISFLSLNCCRNKIIRIQNISKGGALKGMARPNQNVWFMCNLCQSFVQASCKTLYNMCPFCNICVESVSARESKGQTHTFVFSLLPTQQIQRSLLRMLFPLLRLILHYADHPYLPCILEKTDSLIPGEMRFTVSN